MKLSIVAQVASALYDTTHAEDEIENLSSPAQSVENSVVFLSDQKYSDAVLNCKAKYVLIKKGVSLPGKICLEVDDPYVGYARVAQLFEDNNPLFGSGIHPSAIVDPTASIDPTVSIGPYCVIGANVIIKAASQIDAKCVVEKGVQIGVNCRVHSGVIIRRHSTIGDRVIIQSGAIIGSEGFGNALEKGKFIRIPCFGNVIIEDDAEIGANVTIDRGNFEPTRIGKGVKIDNLVHIAHNVVIGENSALAAQVGISGSTKIGKSVIIGGQAGFVGHIEIGDNTFVGAQSGVSKGTEPGSKITGYPARDFMTQRRIDAAQSELPNLLKEIKKLHKKIDTIRNNIESM